MLKIINLLKKLLNEDNVNSKVAPSITAVITNFTKKSLDFFAMIKQITTNKQ